MVFRQKVNARNAIRRKFHKTPASSSILEAVTNQVKRNIISKSTRPRTEGAAATPWKNNLMDDRRRHVNTHKRRQRNSWSPEEEQLLVSLRAGNKAWDEISKALSGRSIEACQQRYEYIRHLEGHHEPCKRWTKPEVEHLESLVQRIGPQWSEIAQDFPGRTTEACKLRYHKQYPVEQQRKPWTESEEVTVLSLLITLGRRWTRISKEIKGRSKDACRMYYHEYIKQYGKLPEACGPAPEEWRQKWGKQAIIYGLQNEVSRTKLTIIDILAAENTETNATQVDLTQGATNEEMDSDSMEFSYPVLNTVQRVTHPGNSMRRRGER